MIAYRVEGQAITWSDRELRRLAFLRWLVVTGRLPVGQAEQTSAARAPWADWGDGLATLLRWKWRARRGWLRSERRR